MANELSVSLSLQYTNGNSRLSIPSAQQLIDVGSQVRAANTQIIGTTAEALDMLDVINAGASFFLNTDATNYVEIGVSVTGTFYGLIRLMPGKSAFCPRLATGTPFARANTSSVNLEYIIFSQ